MSNPEPTLFSLIYDALGYSPAQHFGHPACKVTGILRDKLREDDDVGKLLALNKHPIMLARGHSIRIVP